MSLRLWGRAAHASRKAFTIKKTLHPKGCSPTGSEVKGLLYNVFIYIKSYIYLKMIANDFSKESLGDDAWLSSYSFSQRSRVSSALSSD